MNVETLEAAIAEQRLTNTELEIENRSLREQLANERANRDAIIEQRVLGVRVEHAIETAYRTGKLLRRRDVEGNVLPSKKEARLRSVAERHGLEAFEDEIAELDVLVPLGKRDYYDAPVETATANHVGDELATVAEQLGLNPGELAAEYAATEGR